MSPRGSPDHTLLTHDQHIHYLNVTETYNWAAITTLLDWTEVVNIDMQGVFGWLWWGAKDPNCYIRVKIDGDVLFHYTIEHMFNLGAGGCQNSWGKVNVLRYDAINEFYYCIYDEMWGLYVHENLTVEITYELGSAGLGVCSVHYKKIKE